MLLHLSFLELVIQTLHILVFSFESLSLIIIILALGLGFLFLHGFQIGLFVFLSQGVQIITQVAA
jgi:hypothetical protein